MYVAILFALLGIVYSCDDKLDVEAESFVDEFYRTPAELDAGLAGVYDGMQNAYNEANFVFGEYRTDSFEPSGSSSNVSRTSYHNSTMDASDGSLRWNNFYQTIDRANRVIISGEAMSGASPNTIGEAYAIRSKVYFDMIRIWGNVPLLLEPVTIPADAYKPLSSFDEIMNTVVIPDMLRAAQLVSPTASPFNFSLPSVMAHQAEVYMWLENESLAIPILETLLLNPSYRLANSPTEWQNMFLNQPANNVFPDGTKVQMGPELIFSIRYDDADTTPSRQWLAWVAGAEITVIAEAVEKKWVERFPTDQTEWEALYPNTPAPIINSVGDSLYGDWRQFASREFGDFEVGLGTQAFGDARLHKWTKNRDAIVTNLDRTDIVMYRLADMVLLLAEARIKTGNPEAALTLINSLRTARKLPLVSVEEFGTTPNDQIDYLLDERQFELLGEGKRWWDLIRNNKIFEIMNPILEMRGANPITEDRIVFPIFQNHIVEALGQYEQNPGWD